jgi:hypothetical protein
MKKFTVKDFIAYNNPCFSCGNKINFQIGFLDLETNNTPSYLRPTITPNYTEIDLLITYSNFLKLYILHKTNKILTNNSQDLTKYLSRHKLFLSSTCSHCLTQIDSQYLDFNVEKEVIKAVPLNNERLLVTEDSSMYQLDSSFTEDKSDLVVYRLDKAKPLGPLVLRLPLLPKFRFKNRKHFIEKIKTYITFS